MASTAATSKFMSSSTREFRQTEGATYKPGYDTFFSTKDEVQFTQTNAFAGKSNYFSYFPSTDLSEQRLEKVWFYHKNKQLQDKRRDEESLAFLREWRIAKGRFEAEVQRRKEHLNEATDFQKARGFVRTCWKTKNWNPDEDPCQYDSSSDSED